VWNEADYTYIHSEIELRMIACAFEERFGVRVRCGSSHQEALKLALLS
jgi:hypothetical protein